MEIRPPTLAEHPDFVAFLDAGMRPQGSATRVMDDFPVALGPDNRAGMLGCWDGAALLGGLVWLVRNATTGRQDLPVAGIGSVVTRDDQRGQGLSRRLQDACLAELRHAGVPLAVLWSDRPEVYAGRGFVAAGWEYHADLRAAALDDFLPEGDAIRPFTAADTPAVATLYAQHPLRMRRHDADHAALYAMPGTHGLVLADRSGDIRAYAFAGKGDDFPQYVAEWGGAPPLAAAVLAAMVARGWARSVLVPQGGEDLLALLAPRGAVWSAMTSGLWALLDPSGLAHAVAPGQAPADTDDVRAWLGRVTPAGEVVFGPLRLAVWGFDSV